MTLPLHGHPDWQPSLGSADLNAFFSTNAIAAGGNFFDTYYDMRPYQSYYLTIRATVTPPVTGFGNLVVKVLWINDPTIGDPVYADDYSIFPFSSTGGAFDVANNQLFVQGAVHAPWLGVVLYNSGPNPISVTGYTYGNTRSLPGEFARESAAQAAAPFDRTDNHLISSTAAVAAGVAVNRILRLAPSRVHAVMSAVTQPFTFEYFNPYGEQFEGFTVPAGTVTHTDFMLGRSSTRVRITNTGAGAGNFTLFATAERITL